MAPPRLGRETLVETLEAVKKHGSCTSAARAMGVPVETMRARLRRAELSDVAVEEDPEFEIPALPDEGMSTRELLALRAKQFSRLEVAKEARRLIQVQVKVDGPFGLALFGDPHIDDDGTNIVALQRHVDVIKHTPGLMAANVGDTTNNWIGRLARLYGEQGTTAKQAWQLAEWLFTEIPWLFAIGGNHDAWSGQGDPLKWISRQAGILYQMHGLRLALNLPNQRSMIVNARHTFKGHSQWNAAHAVSKAVQMGHRDHVVAAGHIHQSGYQVQRCPATRRISHAVQIASYKTYDHYAEAEGFPDQNIFVCPVLIVRPTFPDSDPRFLQLHFDPETGADVLTMLRKRKSER